MKTFHYLFMPFIMVVISCQKDIPQLQKDLKEKTDSLKIFIQFMNDNVQKQNWADTTLFYWVAKEIKLNDSVVISDTINCRGIGYRYDESLGFNPDIYQMHTDSGITHMRYFSIGNRGDSCRFFIETDIVIPLVVNTTTGKKFVFYNCPIRIEDIKTNPRNLIWPGDIPTKIEILAVAK